MTAQAKGTRRWGAEPSRLVELLRRSRTTAGLTQEALTEAAGGVMGPDSAAPARSLPTGTVTFLFTGVEGSTRGWEEYPDAMRVALARHDELIETLVDRNHGTVV